MRILLFIFLGCLAAAPLAAEAKEDDFIVAFSPSFVPALHGFETASIQTNLRGFILRGDSFPGINQADPTPYGASLNVAIADAGSQAKRIDRTEQKADCTCRKVQIPPRTAVEDSIEVEFIYGKEVPKEVVSAINACIDKLLHDHPPLAADRRSQGSILLNSRAIGS